MAGHVVTLAHTHAHCKLKFQLRPVFAVCGVFNQQHVHRGCTAAVATLT